MISGIPVSSNKSIVADTRSKIFLVCSKPERVLSLRELRKLCFVFLVLSPRLLLLLPTMSLLRTSISLENYEDSEDEVECRCDRG